MPAHRIVAFAQMPFGGVTDSGYGSEALEPYLVTKSATVMAV
ncbi:hypothetical protein [Burkholderia pyrrocinia]|nr:hypothetical protein [Burkholderia pyrrocinia]